MNIGGTAEKSNHNGADQEWAGKLTTKIYTVDMKPQSPGNKNAAALQQTFRKSRYRAIPN